MNTPELASAVVWPKQVTRLSHPLAAANHRQWTLWEAWVLRDPDKLTPEGAEEIIETAQAQGLEELLARNAEAVISIVRHVVGEFAFTPDMSLVAGRKFSQFTGWVRYAVTKQPSDRERWLLQCRTPFLALPPTMQKSDYTEADKDLTVIAEACGLILADPRPEIKPQTPRHIRRLRGRHALGGHGLYVGTEQNWSNICFGCHRSWSTSY